MPKVSVILTSYNHAKYICEAIDSVLNQTFTDFELIILDDLSSDNSWDLINQYSDVRIKAFSSEGPGNVNSRLNNAILELTTGKYLAITHSDDAWELDKLEKQVAFLDSNPETGAVFTMVTFISEDSSLLTDKSHPYFDVFNQSNCSRYEWLRRFFLRGNALCQPSVLIRKECYLNCGLYSNLLGQLPDLDVWIRLCMKYEIYVLPDKLFKFRIRKNEANVSGSRPDTRIRLMFEGYKVLQNYRNIDNFEELVMVFPSAKKYHRNEETGIDFVLAMVALEEKPNIFTLLFGLDLLFEVLSDSKRATAIKRLYNFEYKDFVELTGRNDPFSIEAIRLAKGSVGWKVIRIIQRINQFLNK
jgi:glycosyltransferase involved in cell wall biosynthesis